MTMKYRRVFSQKKSIEEQIENIKTKAGLCRSINFKAKFNSVVAFSQRYFFSSQSIFYKSTIDICSTTLGAYPHGLSTTITSMWSK
jgi:hypothetical protein